MQGVLIASADSAVRKSLRLILQPGKAVLEAATLSEALILAVSQKLDVILVDDLYSDGTAEDLIQRLHSLGYGVEIVPVLLSLDPLYREPYRPYGIQFFVAKPFDAFHVNHALEGIERLRRAATGQPPAETAGTAAHGEPPRGDPTPDHAPLGDTDLREVTLRLQRLLARSCDRRELLDAFCECLQEQFEANTVAVLLPADGTPEFRIAAGNVSPAVADQFHIPLGEPLLAALTRAGEPVRLLDPHQVGAPNLMAAARYGERLGAEWLCPLVSRGCLAAIVALSRPHRQDPSPAFTSLLRVFLAFFGRALENADRVGRLDHARTLFSGLVAGLPAGLVAVGPDGRVRHLNPAGAALLGVAEDGCGLPVERLDSRLAGIVHSLLAGHGATPALPATFTCHGRELAVTASWPAGDGLGLCLMTAASTPAAAAPADPAGAAESAPAAPTPAAGLEPVWRSMGRVLGHNFKNALVPLKTCADLLPERHADPEFRDSFVNVVRDSVSRLDGWIEELLRFGELDAAGATSRERLSLRELAGMAGQMAQALTGATGVDLRNDIPDSLWVTGNRALLLQAFQELWKNAFAATEGAARPAVSVRAESDGHRATVIFADNGRGLEAAVSRQLFQPFNSNRLSGLGLGLAYVQRVLALHGGMLAAGPGPDGTGTALRVTLPQPEALTAAG